MNALELLTESSLNLSTGASANYEPGIEGVLEIMSENQQDSFKLQTALMMVAHQRQVCLAEGATENAEMLSENVFKNVFDKVKAVFQKMWDRMKEFFKGVRTYFDKMFMNERKFAEKYKTQIQAIKSVSIEGYDLKINDITAKSAWDKVVPKADAYYGKVHVPLTVEKLKSVKKELPTAAEFKDEASKAVVGAPASQFKAEILKIMGFQPKKTDVKYTGSEILAAIVNSNTVINTIKEDESATNKAYQDAIAKVEDAKKTYEKLANGSDGDGKSVASGQASALNTVLDFYKTGLDLVNQIAGYRISAHKKNCKQAKTAAYKGIADGRKDEKATKKLEESADVLDSIMGLL